MAQNKAEPTWISTFIGWIILIAFLGGGGYWLNELWYQPQQEFKRSANWISVPCKIVSADVETSKNGSSARQYIPTVQYEYAIDEKTYASSRLWFGAPGTSDNSLAVDTLKPFEVGSESECFVDPTAPARAVLLKRYNPVTGFGVIISMIALGLGVMMLISHIVYLVMLIGGGSSSQSASELNFEKAMENPTCPIESGEPDEPLIVKASESRVGVAIGLWLLGMFWNGITWIVIFAIGQPRDWFPYLFMGLFALIGLAIFVFAFYSTLQIFNPLPILVCSQRDLYPGSEFELSWMFRGNPKRIQQLNIVLEGIEEVKYRQGTSTRTEKATFFRQDIVNSSDPNQIAQGFQLVNIPNSTMHSFKSTNNSFTWQISAKGKIAFWPDISDRFEIVLLAPKPTTNN